jgi:hypothetical protein
MINESGRQHLVDRGGGLFNRRRSLMWSWHRPPFVRDMHRLNAGDHYSDRARTGCQVFFQIGNRLHFINIDFGQFAKAG